MTLPDPWLSAQQRHDKTWVRADAHLTATIEAAVAEVLAKLWRQVLAERVQLTAAASPPDLSGAAQAAAETWHQALTRWVRPVAYAYYREQYAEQPAKLNVDPQLTEAPIDQWWATLLGRLDETADHIVEAVREEIKARPTESIPSLRDRVARVLSLDASSRKIRDEIAAVEFQLSGTRDNGELLTRRVSLQADLFRTQASRSRSRAYLALADVDPDNADNYRDLARQAARTDGDESRIERLLRQTDDQLFSGDEELGGDQVRHLKARRRELYAEADAEEDTWRNTATRIARTTSTDVLNEATMQRAENVEKASGQELVKTWIAQFPTDGRTRPTHLEAHGQTVPLREEFTVGESKLTRPGDPDGAADEVINCRCSVTYLTREEHEEIAAVINAGSLAAAGETVTETALEDLPPVMWHGVIAKEGVYTGDGRFFEPGAVRTQPLPMPARFQREDWGGHTGAVVTANAEAVRRFQGDIRAWGTFADGSLTPEVDEVMGLMATRMMRGNSVDGDDVYDSQFEARINAEGNVFEHYSNIRLRATTFVAVPAFDGAEIYLGPPPPEWLLEGEPVAEEQNDPGQTAPLDLDAMVAAISRIPENLAEYWTHGEGAAKIRWGESGDFDRCRSNLASYVNPTQLSGMCANLHHRALGVWPGREAAALLAGADTLTKQEIEDLFLATGKSGWDRPFTEDDFAQRQLDGPTPLEIDADGNVYGHAFIWGTCHTGFSDVCVQPPSSKTDYALFHLSGVKLADGSTYRVGKLTVGAGHANGRLSVRPATEHYDNSATAVAVVRMYEDEHGGQFSGRIIPGAPEDKVEELRRSPVSGDWRAYQNNLEMVAALGVNAPGFAVIPNAVVASVDGHQMSLVSAGMLQRAVRDEVAELALTIGLDPKAQAALIAASIPALKE
jgi:hypothetical protein